MKPQQTEEILQAFIEATEQNAKVWGLRSVDGWAVTQTEEEVDIFPLWSSSEAAELAANGDWSVYKPGAIELEEFLEDWLPGMDADGVIIGIDWDNELVGLEIEAGELLENFVAQ